MNNQQPKQCPQCGKEFTGRANKIYCSDQCKNLNFYSKKEYSNSEIKTVNFSDSKPLTNELNVQITDFKQLNNGLNVQKTDKNEQKELITVLLNATEKNALQSQANECEVDISEFIKVKALMNETDTRDMKKKLSEQEKTINELRIKLSFYNDKSNDDEKKLQLNDKDANGFFIEMNKEQMDFVIEKFLDSYDFNNKHQKHQLSNGRFTYNEKEWFLDYEIENKGFINSMIKSHFIFSYFYAIQERLIEDCGYSESDFEPENLCDQFNELEDN